MHLCVYEILAILCNSLGAGGVSPFHRSVAQYSYSFVHSFLPIDILFWIIFVSYPNPCCHSVLKSCCPPRQRLYISRIVHWYRFPSAESFSPMDNGEKQIIFMYDECFLMSLSRISGTGDQELDTQYAWYGANEPFMMHEGHNSIRTLWELFCPNSWGICYSCRKAWVEKEIVDRYVHVIIFTLFVPPKPENLFRNRYSRRRNQLELQRSHHKIFQENFNGIKSNLDLLVWLGESLGLCLPLRFILKLFFFAVVVLCCRSWGGRIFVSWRLHDPSEIHSGVPCQEKASRRDA